MEKASSLSLLTPEDLQRAGATGELDVDANLFDLYPDPVHFVHFSKEIDRADISSELFVRLLEAYRNQKTQGGSPMRSVVSSTRQDRDLKLLAAVLFSIFK